MKHALLHKSHEVLAIEFNVLWNDVQGFAKGERRENLIDRDIKADGCDQGDMPYLWRGEKSVQGKTQINK